MCGICGVVFEEGIPTKTQIKRMTDSMKHRGPDGEGQVILGKCGLGHRRLSILDLSEKAAQPMTNEDKTLWITHNGEVYNYQSIRTELESRGYTFKSNSDTEVILIAYQEWKTKCLEKFRGMFAFAIWDTINEELFLARDRLGQKPLLYADTGKKFFFASELNAIIKGSNIKPKVDYAAIHHYFLRNIRHIPEPYSPVAGIRKLPPATYLIRKNGKTELHRYWKLNYKKENKTEQEWIQEYKKLSRESINLREIADVPIGVLLSGGLDSSTIVAELKNKNVNTYAIGFHKQDPELERAKRIARKFKTHHHEILFNKNCILDLPEMIQTYGEPLNLPPALYTFLLSKEISKDLKVVLSGNGADEIFYGYNGANKLMLITKILNIPFVKHILKRVYNIDKFKGQLYRKDGKKLKRNMYTSKMINELKDIDEGKIVEDYSKECNSPNFIEKMYYVGLMLENSHSTVIAPDTAGMAHSLEIRAPFLDHKIAELGARIPINYKVKSVKNKAYNKYIMKKAAEDILDKDIIYAKKMGFGYNINWSHMIKTEWKELFKHFLLERDLFKEGIFKKEYIKKILKEHFTGKADHKRIIWALFVYEIWYEIVIEGKDYKQIKNVMSQKI